MAEELSFQGDGIDHLPPQNIEAEEAILGGILLDPEAIGRIRDRLAPEAFYIQAHKDIYQAALTLQAQSKPTDLLTITNWLTDNDKLNRIGGKNKLATLIDRTVSAVNIDALAGLVMEKYLRRQLIKAGNEIVQLGYQTQTELPIVLDEAEQKVFGVTQEKPQSGLIHIADTLINAFQEIETRNQGVALPGIPCGFYDLDAMTSGFQRSDLVIIAGRPSMGKCLSYDSEIILADGRIATIEEIYNQRQGTLLTLNSNWKFSFTQPTAFVNDGIKPVFRVTTRLGRSIATTITHPYLTINGWQKLEHIKIGDKVAVPRKIDIFGQETIRECEVKLLSYLIGDGNLINSTPRFTHSNSLLQADFSEAVAEFGDLTVNKNSLTNWLEELGLWGKDAHGKTIPSIIFKLERSQLSLFINRLFATNGWATLISSEKSQLGYATVSKKLAQQIQHLLLRFGVISTLKQGYVEDTKTRRLAWQLDITDVLSIKTFIAEIGIFSQEEALSKITTAISNKQHQLASSDICWDEIIAIDPVGNKQVYDLTIPETHNFVANDICVHNTAFCLNLAHNIAAGYKLPVAMFSLEMSKEQLVQRLLASEAQIESGYLRSGRISQTQWEPLSRAIGMLSEMPIFIDDTPNITVTQMRSQARKLQAEQNTELGLIVLDYLQLMEGAGDNRVQELSRITRSLKGLARELSVPVIALSQLSRGVEARTNKRPMLSDLRESGCLTGDSLITLADQELQVPIKELVGKSGFSIWALNENTMKLEKAIVSHAFTTGKKPVFILKTQLGKKIKATANHKFLTTHGWKRLDQLSSQQHICLAKNLPITAQKTIPDNVFWDKIVAITPDREEEVFDLTVPNLHNFIANNIIVHNSIEQDADLVIMLYRDEYYSPDTPDRGIAEVIIAKHRNGPTGTVKLLFEPQFTRFKNLAKPNNY
ncbi:MAG: replicative DNA helicase [Sphaerospermopsis sp. SIO1G1]|nr:replicative DNA helicase [Sphaerospermopsis sp. SIO1G1]